MSWRPSDLSRVDRIRRVIGPMMTLPQAALRFILAHPAVSSVIPGMMTPAQVDDGVAASALDPLAPDLLRQLQDLGASSG